MSARSIWNGTLTIGLVSVAVKAYKANDEKGSQTAARLVHVHTDADGKNHIHMLNEVKKCHTCNVEVNNGDVQKGVEQEDGSFVILTKADLDSIKPESSDHIIVERFVPIEQTTNPLWIESIYFLSPEDKKSYGAFATVRAAMVAEGRAAQGLLTIHNREQCVTIVPHGDTGLLLQLMRTKSLVRDQTELPNYFAPNTVKVDAAQQKLAQQLVKSLADDFDPTDYEDGYVTEWKALVESKKTGKAVTAKDVKAAVVEAGDLMAALKASLDGTAKPKVIKKIALKAEAKGKSSKKAKAS